MDTRQLLIEQPVGNVSILKRHDQSVANVIKENRSFLEGLPESVTDEAILIKGPVQRADVENKNGRIYPQNVLMREANRLNEIIQNTGGVLGEIDHPDISTVQLWKVPFCVRKLWWEGKDLMAIAEVLDPTHNPNAGIVYSIIKAGLPLGISSRGLGSLNYMDGVNVVQEDFEMVCWDLVSDPSTHSAYMRRIPVQRIKEDVEIARPKTVLDDVERKMRLDDIVKKIRLT
jgi:hypothetical protein